MPAGRPPKTREQKILEGTYRADRDNNERPVFSLAVGEVEPPIELGDKAKAEWQHLYAELSAIGMLQSVDLLMLAAYCQEMGVYWECQGKLKKSRTFMSPSTGEKKTKPEVGIANKALNNAMRIAARFGFTPADRERLKMEKKNESKDDLADLL